MIPAKIFTEVEGWSALDAMYFIEGSENFFDSKNRFLDFNKIYETETHFLELYLWQQSVSGIFYQEMTPRFRPPQKSETKLDVFSS